MNTPSRVATERAHARLRQHTAAWFLVMGLAAMMFLVFTSTDQAEHLADGTSFGRNVLSFAPATIFWAMTVLYAYGLKAPHGGPGRNVAPYRPRGGRMRTQAGMPVLDANHNSGDR